MSKTKKRLLFVCLGNICRSPAAEGVMKKMVHDAGLDDAFDIDSAGIGDWHVGQLPDARMRACGQRHGYKFNSHARQLTTADFTLFDHILVMDTDNYRIVTGKATNNTQREKVQMLADYCTEHPKAHVIPDPYYGDSSDFEYAVELIEDACRGLLAQMIE